MTNSSIFLFRNDLRLQDNVGLYNALKESDVVLPVFIFTNEQIGKSNKYRSDNAIQFMCDSIIDLNKDLKSKNSRLYIFHGDIIKILKAIIKKIDICKVYANAAYTPYALERDKKIYNSLQKIGVEFILYEDYLLLPVGSSNISKIGNKTSSMFIIKQESLLPGLLARDTKVYKKFTPYYNKVKSRKIDIPIQNKSKNYSNKNFKIIESISVKSINKFYKENKDILLVGGRNEGLNQLAKLKNIKNYKNERDYLDIPCTSYLSAYIKFGCISIREVYYRTSSLGLSKNEFIRQLFWRDFYINICWKYPDILASKNRNLLKKFSKMKWKWLNSETNRKEFKNWCEGTTGFPIVDAAMQQLNITGYMFNRARLIVSAFLVKVMGFHWELGERYFAIKLIDYSPEVNNLSWQDAASSSGTTPTFRVINPWIQQKEYDPDCKYIKYWIPELEEVEIDDIHNWDKKFEDYPDCEYIEPMLDYYKEKEIIQKKYSKI